MKKIFFTIAFTLSLSFTAVTVTAQTEEQEVTTYPTPKWCSGKGYWVVETNIHHPGQTLLYFYNNDNVMVYKEKLDGIVINLKKRRVKMNLKKVLEQSVTAYNLEHHRQENQMLVSNLIKRH